MRRVYIFFDKEAILPEDGRRMAFVFDTPFHENLDKHLKELYGEELTFVKEINHRDQIIRLHSAYDSGKGTLYIEPRKRPVPRKRIDVRVREILAQNPTCDGILKLTGAVREKCLIIVFNKSSMGEGTVQIFDRATVNENGYVSGYRVASFKGDVITEGKLVSYVMKYIKYPYSYSWGSKTTDR